MSHDEPSDQPPSSKRHQRMADDASSQTSSGADNAQLPLERVAEPEWLPAVRPTTEESDDGGSGSGSIEVRANIGEGGLFVGNSYAKILFELDVSMQDMLARQAQMKDQLAHTGKDQSESYHLHSEALNTYDDVGVEIVDAEDAVHDDRIQEEQSDQTYGNTSQLKK